MISLFKVHYPEGVGHEIEKVFKSGFITEGEHSDRFENEFGRYVDNLNCSLVNSCTSALTLAYHLCELKPGDEIITTPMTCMATNEPISTFGADLIFADVDPSTGNIDPEDARRKITSKTRAIVGVHWAGDPFEIDEINSIANECDARVIEDAAHALGATYKGKKIGNHSDNVCFSFQAIKHLTTGDGGAIFSKNLEDDERVKKLRWFGLDRKYPGNRWEQDIIECGYKFHMNNLNAVIGLEQMKYIDKIVSSHRKNGLLLDENIYNSRVKKLSKNSDAESSFWIYTLLVDNQQDFKKHMSSRGIASDVVHMRNDRYSVFKRFQREQLPGIDEFGSRMINIPCGWWLSDNDVKTIIDAVNDY